MILAIDVGNSNIVFGCVDAEKITHVMRLHTDPAATDTEYAIRLKESFLLHDIHCADFEAVVISSVVPVVTHSLVSAARMLTGKEAMVIAPGIKTGMNILIDDPGSLAADLLVGSVAAMCCYGTPSIVIDMGTATTMFAVDEKRAFRGGAIMPGVRLSLNALTAGTSLLPSISIGAPKKCIATNTVDCMRSGAIYANAAMIDGMLDRMLQELGGKATLVATGGIAREIIPHCRHEIIVDEDLLLKGLWILYQKNR